MERVRAFLKKVFHIIKRPEMRILPGQLAFFFVLSLIPLIALVGTIAASFNISVSSLEEAIKFALPRDVSQTLLTYVSGKGLNFNIIVFFLSAFILASNGCHSMIITSNEIYKIECEKVLKRRLKAIFMTFILVLLVVFLLIVPVYGNTILQVILSHTNESEKVNLITSIYQILKYPISIFLIYVNIKLLYTIAPDEEVKGKSTTHGAIFTTITWVIATEIYSFYVETFANYDIFYGSISSLIILLMWVYILSYIFVIGMAINAGEKNEKEKEQEK